MAADHSAQESFVSKVIEPTGFAVSLASGIHKRQISRMSFAMKSALDRCGKRFRMCCSNKSATYDCHAIVDQRHGIVG
jgi:hypothetical protein